MPGLSQALTPGRIAVLDARRLPGPSLGLDVRAHLGHHALVIGLEVDVLFERLLDRHPGVPVDLQTIAFRVPEVHAHRVAVGDRFGDPRALGAQPPRELADLGDAAGVERQLLQHLAVAPAAGPQQDHVVLLLWLRAQEVEARLRTLVGDLEAEHPRVEVELPLHVVAVDAHVADARDLRHVVPPRPYGRPALSVALRRIAVKRRYRRRAAPGGITGSGRAIARPSPRR